MCAQRLRALRASRRGEPGTFDAVPVNTILVAYDDPASQTLGRAADEHPQPEAQAHRPEPPVPRRAEGFEDRAVQDVSPHRDSRVELEEEDEHRRHQRTPAHPGHADEDSDQEACDREPGVMGVGH